MQLIDKDKLIETLEQIPCWECDGQGLDECHSCIVERVVDAPVVDAVDVVRCKDCKHSLENNGLLAIGARFCHRNIDGNDVYEPVWGDDYCSKGERKEVKDDA